MATIPAFEITLRQSQNAICMLLGIPPTDLQRMSGQAADPGGAGGGCGGHPGEPAERRPDIRRAERAAAAQSEQIGIAETDWYPHISITGTIGYSTHRTGLRSCSRHAAESGSVGPSFNWDILNYGRIANNVRLQDATLPATLLIYRATVLTASQEAENGLITYLKSHERGEEPAGQRRRRQQGRQDRGGPVQGREGRFHHGLHDRAEPWCMQQNLYAQSLGQIDQGAGPGLPGVGRRLGTPPGAELPSPLPQPTAAPPGSENKRMPTPGMEGIESGPPAANPEAVPAPPPKP